MTFATRLAGCLCLFLAAAAPVPAKLDAKPVPLPGSPGRVGMDYLAFDAATGRMWVPAGNTGKVDVVETATLAVTPIDGFPTLKKGERTMGPSSATVGSGYVYVGNRADSQVCAVDARTLKIGACVTLPSSPDGLAYVAPTAEVWVTTPRDNSLTILDVKNGAAPKLKDTLRLDGAPEGYAVDPGRGLFFTNLEDKDRTLVLDVKTHKEAARYSPGCGEEGPRGLALDGERQLLFVACTDKVVALRLDKNGRKGGQLAAGGGVDNIDYAPAGHRLFVASGKTATLLIAEVAADGALGLLGSAPTAAGARVVVADGAGRGFVADSAGGQLLVVAPGAPTH
jgi:DNA-binding beta-propeller fold protein YncE